MTITRRKFFTRALVALAAGVCGVVASKTGPPPKRRIPVIKKQPPEYTMVRYCDSSGRCVKRQRVRLKTRAEMDWMTRVWRMRQELEGRWV